MAIYSTRSRVTGLSGIDTETMVSQLMKAESAKLHKLQKQNTKLSWKQEAYWGVSEKIRSFQDKFLGVTSTANSIRWPSNFNTLASKITQAGAVSNAVSVSLGKTATTGRHEIEILSLAEKNVYESTNAKDSILAKDTLDHTQILEGDGFTLRVDGKSKDITFDATDIARINGVPLASRDAEVAAVIDDKLDAAFGKLSGGVLSKVDAALVGGKLEIKSTEAGHDISIFHTQFSQIGASINANFGNGILSDVQGKNFTSNVTFNGTTKSVDFDFTGFSSGNPLTRNELLNVMNNALSSNGIPVSYAFEGDNLVAKANGPTTSDIKFDDPTPGGLIAVLNGAPSGTGTATVPKSVDLEKFGNIKNGDTNHYTDSDKVGDIFAGLFGANENYSMVINDKTVTINKNDTIKQMEEKINSSGAGVEFKYEKLAGKFSLSSKDVGATANIKFDTNGRNFMTTFMDGIPGGKAGVGATFKYNGVTTSRDANEFEVDGVTIKFNEVTTVNPIVINVVAETTKVTELAKGFIDGYNELIKGLNDLTAENVAKKNKMKFEPLTDEEKKAMSESEVKLWEERAKEGLLYRDEILSGITEEMRSELYRPVTMSDGTKISLYDLGITTTNVTKDKGKLKIDEEKFQAAIEKYGNEKIADFFTKSSNVTYGSKGKKSERMATQGIAERLNDIARAATSATGSITLKAGTRGSSINSTIWKELDKQSIKLDEMNKYLAKKEDYYYSMFSKMEAAMMKSDNQMAALQSALGLGQK